MKFLVELLFLGPLSPRHPGRKWRDENCTLGYPETWREKDVLLFWPKRGSSRADRALAVPPRDCVYVFICVCVPHGTVLLPYFVCQGKAGSGLLVLSLPSFSPLEANLKEKLPDSTEKEPVLLNIYASVFFYFCACPFLLHVVGGLWPRGQQLIWLEFEDQD